MVIMFGKHEIRIRKAKQAPIREQYGPLGKVAESRSLVDFGWEDSHQFRSWFLILGKTVMIYRKWVPYFKPAWIILPTPPPEQPTDPNVLQFKGKKK